MLKENEKMEFLWGTPMFSTEFSAENVVNELAEIILKKEAEFLATNEVGQHLLFNPFSALRGKQGLLSWDFDVIRLLQEIFEDNVAQYLQEHYPSYSNDFTIEAWANVHRFGDWHGAHAHYTGGREIVSGVFWVRIPFEVMTSDSAGGKLIFFDPRGPFFHERKKVVVTPVAGKLMIFPAWLQHEVTPLKCNEPRISIAFDVFKHA